MTRKGLAVAIVLLTTSLGCRTFFPAPAPPTRLERGGIQSVLVQPQALTEAKILRVVPFTAGEAVVADQGLDRIALGMVKAAIVTVNEAGGPLRAVTAGDVADADLSLTGWIVLRRETKVFRRWWWRRRAVLGVRGELWSRKDNKIVLTFSHQAEDEKTDFIALTQVMGEHIAQYLLDTQRDVIKGTGL